MFRLALRCVGVVGLAVSLWGAADAFLTMSDFVQRIVERWHTIAHTFWNQAFSYFGIKFSVTASAFLTANAFLVSLALSSFRLSTEPVRFLLNFRREKQEAQHEHDTANCSEISELQYQLSWEMWWVWPLVEFAGRIAVILVAATLQLVIAGGAVYKHEPQHYAPSFSARFEGGLSAFDKELESMKTLPSLPESERDEIAAAGGIFASLKRAVELGVLTPEMLGLLVAFGVGGLSNILLMFPKPLAIFRRLLEVSVLTAIVVAIGVASPHLAAMRDWLASTIRG